MFAKKTIHDLKLSGKTVMVRVDFNVPIKDGIVSNDYRIRQALPTIEHLRGSGAKVVLVSHLGRPKSKNDLSLSLAPVAVKLSDLLHLPVKFASDCIGKVAKEAANNLKPGEVLLLENLRFHSRELANDTYFAKELASVADIFVQDGFGVVHRKQASTEAITHFLPSVAGLLLQKEVNTITHSIESPARPLVVVIGGAKISDKIDLISHFIKKADFVAVVGAIANTFLLAQNIAVGHSLVDEASLEVAKDILEKAEARTKKDHFTFYLPHDVVVARTAKVIAPTRVVDIAQHTWSDIYAYPKQPARSAYTIQSDESILDIGPMSAATIAGALKLAGTSIWNGTCGMAEVKGFNGAAAPFAHGSKIIAEAMVGQNGTDKNRPFSLVGGGDTTSFVMSQNGLAERFSYVSTGGGATLELMAGKKLPGVEALLDKKG